MNRMIFFLESTHILYTVCDTEEFGAGCTQTCHCANAASCNGYTGQCDDLGCGTGWSGHNCQSKCYMNHYCKMALFHVPRFGVVIIVVIANLKDNMESLQCEEIWCKFL